MNMTVMNVREVRVAVLQRVVPVRMLVLDAWRDVCRVGMAVVFVVNMRMVVFHCFVLMRMLMMFSCAYRPIDNKVSNRLDAISITLADA